ncbi:MAG TPA: UDP-4-amino-4,6-dideoxy-N-acetyl-beta-L-altrosamine transaminase [Spirochaetia bacterium]|nr:UDP-4-amino-4,6-dideoxy-N-acetyl-beta-L-altrosamine transaminase [Spirochaetia bacterium]
MNYKPNEFLSYGKQWIDDEDIEAVVHVLKGDFLTQGPAVEEFENAICKATGARYCTVVSNGTAALHLAVAALKLEKGSSGITSPITFAASANCMAYCGVRPDFADIDEETLCVDPEEIERCLKKDTKLLIPVHLAGVPADMQRIAAIAREHKLCVIEDAAHAMGTLYPDGSAVGSCTYSDMTIFSFHPVKTITTGEGGAVMTNDEELHERLMLLRAHGITKNPLAMEQVPGPWYYEMQELGFNYRLTDIQAALGLSQIRKLRTFVSRRRDIVEMYNNAFSKLPWVRVHFPPRGTAPAYHLYIMEIDFPTIRKSRSQVMRQLQELGIGTQVHYIPVHTFPYYKKTYGYYPEQYPKAMKYYQKALSLPLYPRMSNEDVQYVIEAVTRLA